VRLADWSAGRLWIVSGDLLSQEQYDPFNSIGSA
jgi:hypothetical protein